MSWLPHDEDGAPSTRLAVDRVACTGHGVCAHLLPGAVTLDERGYPILGPDDVAPRDADVAIGLCPARALYRRTPPPAAPRRG